MRRLLPLLLPLAGCGYLGDPMPPLLNIPERAEDVTIAQRGDSIVVAFTPPLLTTEGVEIRKAVRYEVRLGEKSQWPQSTEIAAPPADGRVHAATPAGPWIGREVVAAVRVIGANGRDAGWTPLASATIIPPLAPPQAVDAANVREGVRITWQSPAPSFRILRRAEAETALTPFAEASATQQIDSTTEYGRTYEYQVIAVNGSAESLPGSLVTVKTEDTFAPSVPSGLNTAAGTDSIELVWTPSPESDTAGYRIYRAEGAGAFARIADTQAAPSFTDRTIAAGKTYRYAVSSVDRSGNESARSEPVEVTLP